MSLIFLPDSALTYVFLSMKMAEGFVSTSPTRFVFFSLIGVHGFLSFCTHPSSLYSALVAEVVVEEEEVIPEEEVEADTEEEEEDMVDSNLVAVSFYPNV